MKHYGLDIPEGSDIKNITLPTGSSFPPNENAGELFFRTDENKMYVYSGAAWIDIQAIGHITRFFLFTATADQTVFTGLDDNGETLSYDIDNVGVFYNGVLLDDSDYTTTDADTLTLTTGATAGHLITIINFEAAFSDDFLKITGGSLTGSLTVAGVISDEIGNVRAGRKNVIINGNFDIWQRGSSSTSNGYFADDRWRNQRVGSTQDVSQQAFVLGQTSVPNEPTYFSRTVVTSVVGAGNSIRKQQRLEDVRTLAGKTVTLSFWAKADSSKNIATEFVQHFGLGGSASPAVTGVGVTTHALTTTWQKFTVTATIPSISGKTIDGDLNHLRLNFWLDAGSDNDAYTNSLGQQSGTFDFAQVQLEEGTEATDFENRTLGEELALCERYYSTGYVRSDFYITGSTNSRIHASFKQTMRTVPTIVLTDLGSVNMGALGASVNAQNATIGSASSGTGNTRIYASYTVDAEI